MKMRIKFFANHFALILLSASIFGIAGCAAWRSDPLAGGSWKMDFAPTDPAIEKDYQDFIQTEGKGRSQATGYFKDGTGQHAVSIEIFIKGENASWQYVLIYDKENKRIKVIKYGYRRYES
jgi:hypothetical protein